MKWWTIFLNGFPQTQRCNVTNKDRAKVLNLIAEYMRSEGCGCCGDYDKHREDTENIAKFLHVPAYDDNSGYDFSAFYTKEK